MTNFYWWSMEWSKIEGIEDLGAVWIYDFYNS